MIIRICLRILIILGTVTTGVAAEVNEKIDDFHRQMSIDCFNQCWTLIDKTNRLPEDVENMILLANVSLWHWKQRTDCKPIFM